MLRILITKAVQLKSGISWFKQLVMPTLTLSNRRVERAEQVAHTRTGGIMRADTHRKSFTSWICYLLSIIALSMPTMAVREVGGYDHAKVQSEISSTDWKIRRRGLYDVL